MCPAKVRLGSEGGFDEIKEHPFFKGTQWNKLRKETPPFVPQLDSPTDSSYFHIGGEKRSDSGPMTGNSGSSGKSPSIQTKGNHEKTEKKEIDQVEFGKARGHKKLSSYDFIGFTYKPPSWMHVSGDLDYASENESKH